MASETRVFVGLGGNLGGANAVLGRFAAALQAMAARLPARDLVCSRIYRSAPVGPVPDQPAFLNAVASFSLPAGFPARAVLAELLAIEAELGRDRAAGPSQGPRTVDLDLLFIGDQVVDEPGPPRVIVPHPRLCERAFVLRPLAELTGPDWRMPPVDGGAGPTVAECLADPGVAHQDVEVYASLGPAGEAS
jgi:2-amino-4-hydroxy-6-hydroxymethyldihydropteridine diphosphokinase